jgi:hypothetical protein
MQSSPHVVKAEYRGGYRIHVTFDDKSAATVNFERWLKGPVFRPLKDLRYFQRFFLDGCTVAWPNGADVAPETLHERVCAGRKVRTVNRRQAARKKRARG